METDNIYDSAARTIPGYFVTLANLVVNPRKVFALPRSPLTVHPGIAICYSFLLAFFIFKFSRGLIKVDKHMFDDVVSRNFLIVAIFYCGFVCAIQSGGLIVISRHGAEVTLSNCVGMLTYAMSSTIIPGSLILAFQAYFTSIADVVAIVAVYSVYIWSIWNVCRIALRLGIRRSFLGVFWCLLVLCGVGLAAELIFIPELFR